MAQHSNTTGSLTFDGLGGTGYSRGTKKYDHNHSGLTPVTSGGRTNLKGNMGGLESINGSQPIIGGVAKPQNRHDGRAEDSHVAVTTRGSRTNLKGNQ